MNIQKMMKQAQEMQTKIAEMQAKLEAEETEGSSGGGMVVIRLNGKNQMLRVQLDPSILKAEDKEMVEDLIIAAYNDARGKIENTFSSQMNQMTSGLNLPPGFKLPF